MNAWWQWLFGLDAPPDWISGGSWHFEFYALPTGPWSAGCLALVVLAVAGVWYLYRREGNRIPRLARYVLAGIRLLILLGVSFMLLELVLVLTNKELVPSRLLVLLDTSESMGLADPYADNAIVRPWPRLSILRSSQGEPDIAALRKHSRLELAQRALTNIVDRLAEGRELSAYHFAAQLDPLANFSGSREAASHRHRHGIGRRSKPALAAHRGQPLAGVLLVSDGQSQRQRSAANRCSGGASGSACEYLGRRHRARSAERAAR